MKVQSVVHPLWISSGSATDTELIRFASVADRSGIRARDVLDM
jgi:hypothetical protein